VLTWLLNNRISIVTCRCNNGNVLSETLPSRWSYSVTIRRLIWFIISKTVKWKTCIGYTICFLIFSLQLLFETSVAPMNSWRVSLEILKNACSTSCKVVTKFYNLSKSRNCSLILRKILQKRDAMKISLVIQELSHVYKWKDRANLVTLAKRP
jgi:hypothetical protein